MLRVNNFYVGLDEGPEDIAARLRGTLDIDEGEEPLWQVVKKSVDARKRNDIRFVLSLNVRVKDEARVLAGCKSGDVTKLNEAEYAFPKLGKPKGRAVVAGAGPAGLFCALMLLRAGAQVTVLERGKPVEQRSRDVERFWKSGVLDPESNVQFGEGGAGTFSDGKLTTGIGDPRLGFITKEFIAHGAPEDIGCLAKPHIGTDRLRDVVKNIRLELLSLGADLRFESYLAALRVKDGRMCGVAVQGREGAYDLDAEHLILATGHSARDTFEMLYASQVEMLPKNTAVGVRIEHLQKTVTEAQYGAMAGHPALPVPDYKLACHLGGGRSVFSFCVCPGGQVVASASEAGRLVTNGMSEYLRDGENINGGLLVGVSPVDYGSGHPLAGIAFARDLEKAAFELGGGDWFAPAQLAGDFLKGRPSKKLGSVQPTYKPGVRLTDIRRCLPELVHGPLAEALPILGRKLKGFDGPDAVLTAVESRSSSPVRILRDDKMESSIRGIYPCGEGAGFAGGIMSAAADGIRCAEAVYGAMCG